MTDESSGHKKNGAVADWFLYGLNKAKKEIYVGSAHSTKSGDDVGIDAQTAEFAIKGIRYLDGLETKEPIRIILNSTGGDENHGYGIFDAIISTKGYVDIEAIGACKSMATLILQAGRRRLLHRNTTLMIHKGKVSEEGDPDTLFNAGAFARNEMLPRMYAIFAARSGREPSFWAEMCSRGDYIMTAQQAIELGLADDFVPLPVRSESRDLLDKIESHMEAARATASYRK